ncbi:MAG: hypothetical protein KA978_02765 [Deltaproteobacteria bacterium]|nr:hypothetical protein [Deltaproteobacteria bacterium]
MSGTPVEGAPARAFQPDRGLAPSSSQDRATVRVRGFGGHGLNALDHETSLHPNRDHGSLGRFCLVARIGGVEMLNCDYLTRYVRWNVVQSSDLFGLRVDQVRR